MFAITKKTLSHLIACAALLSLAAVARADDFSVTVADNFPGQGPFLRWDQFSTDLTATIHNPPVSTTETTITGPTYAWSINGQNPSSPAFPAPIDSGNGNATVKSPTPSKSVCFIAGGGTYDINVKCVVTYISTDNKTGQPTPIAKSGTTDVTFFVRVPVIVVETAARTIDDYNGQHVDTPNYHGPIWGFVSRYPLQCKDNQMPAQPYGNGLLRESFPTQNPPDYYPNSIDGGASVWTLNGDGTGTPTDTWTDSCGQLYGGTDPGPINQDKFEGSVTQNWDCMEATPPYSSPQLYATIIKGTVSFLPNVNDTALVPLMSLKVYDGYTIRTFPGDPYPD